jgi:hypothetical protein
MNKKIVLAGSSALLLFVLTNVATAQSSRNQTQQPVQNEEQIQSKDSTEENAEEVSESPERVTLAGDNAARTSGTSGDNSGTRSETTTKIYIYSGKHDGNNVINPDPKHRD